jgi:aspartyl aminopeptidase
MKLESVNELINFINKSPSVFHAVESSKKILLENGFKQLDEKEKWELEKGSKYFICKNNSALIAFEVGKGKIEEDGFRIIGAHTDSPGFKIKPNSEILTEGTLVSLNTETYGGPILSTWFDRPLTLAGKVIIKGESITNPIQKLINIKKPIMIIPNVAIHFNREVNDGYKYNKQKDMLPILGFISKELDNKDYLLDLIASELGINKNEILDYDLYLNATEEGTLVGLNDEFISIGKLDDLWMVFAGIKAIVNSDNNKSTKIMMCFDNEEVGSTTAEGANSNTLINIMSRINYCLGNKEEELQRGLANSFMISADLAHGIHPNYIEKHDPTNKPKLGEGVVIKYSANKKYGTDALVASIIKQCCDKADVPVQLFVNRSDALGGSTIGPVANSSLTIPVADVGPAILAMHSVRELGAVKDNEHVLKAFKYFFEL